MIAWPPTDELTNHIDCKDVDVCHRLRKGGPLFCWLRHLFCIDHNSCGHLLHTILILAVGTETGQSYLAKHDLLAYWNPLCSATVSCV